MFKLQTLIVLTLIILSSVFAADAQSKRGKTRTAKTTKNASTEKPARERDFSFSSPSNETMSAAWTSGELPQPLAVPKGNDDEFIAVLAQKIAAKNDESVSALLTALQLSGFFITDKDGAPLHTPPDGKGQGLPINGWEAAGAARMFGDNRTVKLAELGDKLKSIAGFEKIDVAAALLDGVRQNAANDANPYLKNWARLIIELGKNSRNKYDIQAGATAAQVELDAIQHLLLMRRLYGDLWAQAEKYKTPDASPAQIQSLNERRPPRLIGASFAETNFSDAENQFEKSVENKQSNNALIADDAEAQKKIPCRMDGSAPTIMDATAAITGEGFKMFLKYLEGVYKDTPTGDSIKKFGMYQAAANIILAYAKFIQTYAALEVTLALEEEPPLIRTKDGAPGEQKQMQAKVKMNIGNWQMYNCIRTAMNVTAGIDFATLNDGPIADVGVNWHIGKGGGKGEYSNSTGIGADAIVGFAKNGAVKIQDEGAGAGVGTKGNRVGNLVYMKTDDKGAAEITIEGAPQKNYKKGRIMPVMKEASVHVTIKMKAGEIKGDMVDVGAQAVAGVPGLIALPAELLYRADWFSSGSINVPVKDWEYCEGGWRGTVTRTTKFRKDKPQESRYGIYYNGYEEWTEKVELNVNGEMDPRAGLTNGYFADGKISFAQTVYSKTFWEDFECTEGRGKDKIRKRGQKTQIYERKNKVDAPAETTVYVMVIGNRGTLDFSIPQATGETFYKELMESPCPVANYQNTRSYKDDSPFDHNPDDVTEFVVEADPKNPDTLKGKQTVTNSDGSESTYTWDLVRCGNSF